MSDQDTSIEPDSLPARLLEAEARVADGAISAARDLLHQTAEVHPTSVRVLQELTALVQTPTDYERLRRQWLRGRMRGLTAPGGGRTVAKAATLIDDFAAATEIYRWLIDTEIGRVATEMAAGLVRPAKRAAGRVGRGRGEQALADLKALLDDAGTPFFLISGTLLGYLREGQLLSDDKDIDVGVFQHDYDQARLTDAFRRSPLFDVKRLDDGDRLRVAHVNGVWIDVFPHYRQGDRIWHDGTVSRWWNTPFEIGSMTINGTDYAVPDPPERYLDENYGDWRVPNAMFDVRYEAPNAEVRSPQQLELMVYTRTLEGLLANRWEVVAKYGADFPELFASDSVLQRATRISREAEDRMAIQSVVAVKAARRRKPNHVRVAKWFVKRWRRLTGR
jgi:hypothetical protein